MIKRALKQKPNNDRGIAMTEVIVAFLLLTIIFGILYNCIHFASNMMMKAADTDRANAVYEEKTANMFMVNAAHPDPYNLSPAPGVSALSLNFERRSKNDTAISTPTTDDNKSFSVVTASVDIPLGADPGSGSKTVYLYSTKDP